MHTKFYFSSPLGKPQISFEHYFSLVEDPLWKYVCAETVSLMGPLALQICQAQLGTLSLQHKSAELYCKTEEMLQFLQKYNFIILGSLKKYFPNVKALEIKVERL